MPARGFAPGARRPPVIFGNASASAVTAATSQGVVVTCGATNAEGNYAQLTAATASRYTGMWVTLGGTNAAGDYLIDIATGAAAAEVVVVQDLLYGGQNFGMARGVFIPITIEAGTRLAARGQSTANGPLIQVAVTLVRGGFAGIPPLRRCITYGSSATDSGGTSVDPGADDNAKGGYSEITAATTAPIHSLIIGVGNQANAARVDANFLCDIATGAAGSETVIIPDIHFIADDSSDNLEPSFFGPFPIYIPSGTRLAARGQTDITDATDRLFDIILYGLTF